MEVNGKCTAETSAAFLRQLRAKYNQPLIVIWDNAPIHHGEALRQYLSTLKLNLRLVPLPSYSPDFNADETIWDWVREEVKANFCLGTKARVQEKVGQFFRGLAHRAEEVKQRCRSVLEGLVDQMLAVTDIDIPYAERVDPILVSV